MRLDLWSSRACFYADEDFPLPVVQALRTLSHDVVTSQDDGRQSSLDQEVLERAHELGRAVLTHNRREFEKLHRSGLDHNGILSATRDPDSDALARRIDQALASLTPARWCLRVNRPAP